VLHLFLLLLGTEMVRSRWRIVFTLGCVWFLLGMFILVDALDDDTLIPIRGLAGLLLLEGFLTLASAAGSTGAARRLRVVKGAGLVVVGALAVTNSAGGNIALALIIGVAFAADGVLKITAARLIRFRGWRTVQGLGLLSLVLSVFTLQPWPTWYVGTIGANIGVALALTGCGAMQIASRLRKMEPNSPVSELFGAAARHRPVPERATRGQAQGELIVHVWTPKGGVEGGEDGRPVPHHRPVIGRYIATLDADGVISTGHTAIEVAPDLYISHYPAEEIERSAIDFRQSLRGTADNDRTGWFQPSYTEEAAGWCPSTVQVHFDDFNAEALREFWENYRKDATYNLTARNCSTVVVAALDAALEGSLAKEQRLRSYWPEVVRAALSPELWVAAVLRKRAETMAWTPGLALDYAWALNAVLKPQAVGWATVARRALQRAKRA